MRITLIAVGKIKEKFYTEALSEYSKRLSKYVKLEVIEVADEKTPDQTSEREKAQILDKEAQRILAKLPSGTYVIPLAIEGTMLSSEGLAEKLAGLGLQGDSHVAFIIGGSLGLADSILDRADFKLSFSKMTFPHQLMRVILLEQVYRAMRILRNEPYHK
ncbi:23S rRNA (pseudouridine(1915)-N(3))-methyltransferase RlmH [Acidaminobacter sp.]|uniref:23S rRNA (pseudouridine(1915)-N(3))-methyltransferase RlmH n=1 Tax=Acidaminobacter sp. TaxID=1872102 RepID=UPI00138426E8|nr:23S rRNA (pseudouridine(1915)-N(3))-methyltransferase RlmH [Acidaminobacter sp.]MDK9710198.1 23S rRNA (pseudouridine(1915)-N(3))-methyltransferase RlmH [Acidaminobacter sp.]MZQ98716.1 23S rRNA (pseudouridine(1915)-N(3))-methyltransferase RlmH [Acidaminobacter sp.]